MIDIIIPVYNEKENIAILCQLIAESLDIQYKICIIDDSTDETSEIINKLKEKYPIIHIRRLKKSGIGSAYKIAIKNTKNPYIVIMDGDLSHDPKYISRFFQHNSDIVISTRYKGGGTIGWPLYRKIISRSANNLAQIFLGIDYSDVTGSFRLYKRKQLEQIVENIKGSGFNFQVEALFWANKLGFRIEEEPIIFYERIISNSKLNLWEYLGFLMMIFRLFVKRLKLW